MKREVNISRLWRLSPKFMRCADLFRGDRESQCSGTGANALVKAQDRERADSRLGEQSAGDVNSVKRSNRFTWKKTASTLDDFIFKP